MQLIKRERLQGNAAMQSTQDLLMGISGVTKIQKDPLERGICCHTGKKKNEDTALKGNSW